MIILKGQVPHTTHSYTKHSHTKKKPEEKERQQKKAKYTSIKQRKAILAQVVPSTRTTRQAKDLEAQVSSSYIRELKHQAFWSHERQPEVQSCVSYLLRMSCRP